MKIISKAKSGVGLLVVFAMILLAVNAVAAPQSPVALGTAGNFVVLAGPAISSTSGGTINGDIGTSPGNTFTPGTPAVTVNGILHLADAVALQGQNDLVTAYNDAEGRATPTLVAGGELGGLTLPPGLYKDDGAPASLGLTGVLTLDAQGDPNAVWIFQSASTLIAEANSSVVLANGAQACNVFWQVGSSATLRTGASFKGNIMALSAISLETLATLDGRILARNAAVTLDNNTIGISCGVITFTGVPTNTTAACDNIPAPALVTATNSCYGTAETVVLQESIDAGGTATDYTIRRIWTVADVCSGGETAVTQLIAVACSTAPECGPLTISTPCGSIYRSVKEGHLVVPLTFTITNQGSVPAGYTVSSLFLGSASDWPWFSMTPKSGVIAGSSSVEVTVMFTYASTNLAIGAYPMQFTVESLCSQASVPATLTIILQVGPDVTVVNDLDGDGTSDLSLYWPDGGIWHTIWSSCCNRNDYQFGWKAAVPVSGDYDGDGRADLAVYWPEGGQWYILNQDGVSTNLNWSLLGAQAVPADYDGDGMTDLAVYQPNTGTWHIRYSGGGSATTAFGWYATKPVPADYDGDGKADLAVYYPTTGMWYIFGSTIGFQTHHFGFPGAIPVGGDYDGDGQADLAMYDPQTGAWHFFGSSIGYWSDQFGFPGTIPVSGDYDGDGRSDLALYYPPTGTWFIYGSYRGFMTSQFGWSAALPTAGNPLPGR